MDKETRAWNVFVGLDSMVKNMVTSLHSVAELQNQAIRDRHWEQVMQATQVCNGGGFFEPPSGNNPFVAKACSHCY